MHRQTDLDTSSELDDDFDFVFDLQSLELFETTPVTRPPGEEELGQELDLALGGIGDRLVRLARRVRRQRV